MLKSSSLIYSVILSAIFTVALFYSTLELPSMLDRFLVEFFPDYSVSGWNEAEQFIEYVRPLGYASLTITIILVILGFTLKREKLSFLGSIMLYLPTFSYFAFSMFFLTGIGVLRILWLPFIELAPGSSWPEKIYAAGNFLELGDIAYLPYDIVRFLLTLFESQYAYPKVFDEAFFKVIMFTSLILFFTSCVAWFYAKFQKRPFADFAIYKYSRHPQYLSFIIWSYGLLIYDKYVFTPARGGYFAPPSLLWLLTILILIGTALREERAILKRHCEEYEKYVHKTPFMLPLGRIGSILKAPVKLVFKKNYPEKNKEITVILTLYFLILLAMSVLY